MGTTNRTRIGDFRGHVSDRTGAILKVHPSNYRVVGFTATVPAKDLAALAGRHDIPFLYDVGSGLLSREHGIPSDEPTVAEALSQGADLVTFSGDKLLGGPQAGIIVGRADLIETLRRNPVARAVRVDKMQVAALESRPRAPRERRRPQELPVLRMIGEPAERVHVRAQELAGQLDGDLEGAHVQRCESSIGGGSAPGSIALVVGRAREA